LVVQVEIEEGDGEEQGESDEGDEDGAPSETAIPSDEKTMVNVGLLTSSRRHCSYGQKTLLKRF
jgi:hypothetical protein